MKKMYPCTLFFHMLFCFSLLCQQVQAQQISKQKVSLQADHQSLESIFRLLEQQTGYTFAYNNREIKEKLAEKFSFAENSKPLSAILDMITRRTRLQFRQSGTIISVQQGIAPVSSAGKKEPGKITGRIIDEENGQPVVGANVHAGDRTAISGADGTFSLSLTPGSYTVLVSYTGYMNKEIAEVEVKDNQAFELNATLKRGKGQLTGVVVKSSARKESIAALYTEQKNRASMSDGISAEQIARTPDNNVGAVLKRVSGVNTIDNKYVVVRGLTERYNQAMIDGIAVPSTDMNRRNFSFDVIPAELVSSVVVNKTATPDVSSEFSGGQVIVNTLAIPVQNFLSVTIGAGYNSQTTGKDFLQVGGRGRYDYLAFDDGRRKAPEGIKYWMFKSGGGDNDNPLDFQPDALEQSKRFDPNGYKLYNNIARPNQNYRFTIGRLYHLNEKTKIGFAGGATYRNTQEINKYTTARGYDVTADWLNTDSAGRGIVNKFNTTWGAAFNAGIEGEKYKINIRNLYTRMLNDDAYDVYKRQNDALERKERSIFADPVFTYVMQTKLDGEHQLTKKGLLLNWSAARTSLSQHHNDLRSFTYRYTTTIEGKDIYQTPGLTDNQTIAGAYNYDYRLWTTVQQTDYNWAVSLSQPFSFLKEKSLLKAGYAGWQKERQQGTIMARLFSDYTGKFFDLYEGYESILAPERIGWGQDKAYYYADAEQGGDQYKGKSKNHSLYLMLDQRLFKKLRLVYGVRAENFNSKNAQLAEIETRRLLQLLYPDVTFVGRKPVETGEKNWRFLPSVNLTYNLTGKMNLRAAYAVTMVRPDLRENATMAFVDPLLRGPISGGNLASTLIKNYDVRYEWYPSAGEILSVTGFYKHFDKPVELMKTTTLNQYYYTNQKSATNLGLEMELRKSLGFIADRTWLQQLTLFGNATIMKSEVTTLKELIEPIPGTPDVKVTMVEADTKRPLFGQSPFIVNAGISYTAAQFGVNAVYNRSGYRTYTIEDEPGFIEYENGRDVIDLQLSARLLRQKLEIRLNISNLLDNAAIYYINPTGYKGIPGSNGEWASEKGAAKYNKADGDFVRHKVKYGTTTNLSFTYHF